MTLKFNALVPPFDLIGEAVGNSVITGNGEDQTVEVEEAVTNAPKGGTIWLAPGESGQTIKVKETITIEKSLTIRGTGMNVEYGSLISNEPTAFNQQVMPAQEPYMRGSVIEMTEKNKDVIHITGDGICVNIYDLGIIYKTLFKETGHGIVGKYKNAEGAWGKVPNNGPQGMVWSNVCVFGHDGNHYAYELVNSQLNSFNQLQSFGGGMMNWNISEYEGKFGNPSNSTITELYGVLCARGTAHGVNLDESNVAGSNSLVFLRPQIMGLLMNQFAGLSEGPDFTKQFAYRDHGKGTDLLIFGGDVEGGEAAHEFKIEGSKTGWLNVFIGGLVQAPTGTLEVNANLEVLTKIKTSKLEATTSLSVPSTGVLTLSGPTHWGHIEEPGLPSGTTSLLTESGTPVYEVEANVAGSTIQGLESSLEGNSSTYVTVKNIGTGLLTLAHEAGPVGVNRFKFAAGDNIVLAGGQAIMLWHNGSRWTEAASFPKPQAPPIEIAAARTYEVPPNVQTLWKENISVQGTLNIQGRFDEVGEPEGSPWFLPALVAPTANVVIPANTQTWFKLNTPVEGTINVQGQLVEVE